MTNISVQRQAEIFAAVLTKNFNVSEIASFAKRFRIQMKIPNL